MKLFLFGGAESSLWQFLPQLKLIEKVIHDIKPKQILHIPFARTIATEPERKWDWFNRHINIWDAKYLNASSDEDIKKAKNPLVFISGGWKSSNLVDEINKRPDLINFIKNAEYLVCESAGWKVLWEYFRDRDKIELGKGLWIIKNTIIEPHYSEKKKEKLLLQEIEESWMKYWIWIDCATAIEFNLEEFPKKWSKIWNGKIVIENNNS